MTDTSIRWQSSEFGGRQHAYEATQGGETSLCRQEALVRGVVHVPTSLAREALMCGNCIRVLASKEE